MRKKVEVEWRRKSGKFGVFRCELYVKKSRGWALLTMIFKEGREIWERGCELKKIPRLLAWNASKGWGGGVSGG